MVSYAQAGHGFRTGRGKLPARGLFPGAPLALLMFVLNVYGAAANELDTRVERFLQQHRGSWHDLNVPEADGRLLRDLVVRHGFTRALEIGTSTGHSTLWIAWGLSRSGGHLTTIEIDEQRLRRARENIRAAGLSDYVTFLQGNAHDLVPRLAGPFDFVFSDADKEWYTNYFKAVYPKLTDKACFTAHNVSSRWMSGIGEFLDYVKSMPDMETTLNRDSSAGVSISCKK